MHFADAIRLAFASLSRHGSGQGDKSLRHLIIFVLLIGLLGCEQGQKVQNPAASTSASPQADAPQELTSERLGDLAAQQGDFTSAKGFYSQAFQQNPNNPALVFKVADAAFKTGDYPTAEAALNHLIKLDNKNQDAFLLKGQILLAKDQPQSAILAFEAALAGAPGLAKALSGKAVALDLMGQHVQAQEIYRQVLAQSPDNIAATNNLALSLGLTGAYEEAIQLLLSLVSQPTATARHRQNLALIYGLQGDLTQAAAFARRDLPEEQVQKNLAIYPMLREKPEAARKAAFGIGVIEPVKATELPAPNVGPVANE